MRHLLRQNRHLRSSERRVEASKSSRAPANRASFNFYVVDCGRFRAESKALRGISSRFESHPVSLMFLKATPMHLFQRGISCSGQRQPCLLINEKKHTGQLNGEYPNFLTWNGSPEDQCAGNNMPLEDPQLTTNSV